MPASWGFAIVLFVVATIALVVAGIGFRTKTEQFFTGGLSAAAVAIVLGLIFTVAACYDRVDTRNVGIVTKFGRPTGIRTAGIAWHMPWERMSELSEAIQLQAFESGNFADAAAGKGIGNNPSAIGVRLANNSMAYVNANLNWRLREGAAPKLFQDYGGNNVFDTIKQQLVDRQEQVALSKTFSRFNPQILTAAAAAKPGAPEQAPTPAQGANLPKMADDVKKELQDAVGTEIEILDVRIQGIFYDDQTQGKIDAYNQKVQDTINAQQDVQTAMQKRAAAEQIAQQPAPDLKVAQFNCIQEAVTQHRPADAAGCFGQIGGNPLINVGGH